MAEVIHRCQETLKPFRRKKKVGHVFKKIDIFCRLILSSVLMHLIYICYIQND